MIGLNQVVRMRFYLFLLAGYFFMGTMSSALATPIANSVTEFSDIQGQNNWYYGYYDDTVHPDGVINSDDWAQMPEYVDPSFFMGDGRPAWMVDSVNRWTGLYATGGHPNGVTTSGGRTSGEQWAVRSWVSEVSGDIGISGRIFDLNPNLSVDGVNAYIFVDGVQVGNFSIPNNGVALDYSFTTLVSLGSFVDFAIAPGAGSDDRTDDTYFSAVIAVPEPTTWMQMGMGLVLFLLMGKTIWKKNDGIV